MTPPTTPERPQALSVWADRIPELLQEHRAWVVWRYVEDVDPETGEVDWDKPPANALTGGPASSTNPKTWAPFAVAVQALQTGRWDGIGLVLCRRPGEAAGLVGIDLDHCRDPQTGAIDPWALDVVERLDTYAEVSPSGCGLRLFLLGTLPPGRRKNERFECYETARYVTVTGHRLEGAPRAVEARQAELEAIHREVFGVAEDDQVAAARPASPSSLSDRELVERACADQKTGARFRSLWAGEVGPHGSHSEADLALVNYLAFWTGGSESRIDELFRASGLFRSKWNREDYRRRTIARAMQGRTDFYEPRPPAAAANGRHKSNGDGAGKVSPETTEERPLPDVDASDVATIADLRAAGSAVSWVWEGWIPDGVLTAIAAPAGTGKTRLVGDLLRRINLALPWPDGQAIALPPDALSLWVVADNHHDQMVQIAEAYGIETNIRINASKADPYGGVTLETPDDYRGLEARIKAVRPRLVVVDTVGNATDKNLSRQEDAKAFYQPLQVLARRYRCAILCITHLNAGGQFLGRRVLEKVRVAIRLDQYEGEPRQRLEVVKTFGKKPPPLGVTMGDVGNEYDTNPPSPPTLEPGASAQRPKGKPGRLPFEITECMDWLREQLRDAPLRVSTLRDRASIKGFSPGTLYRAKDALGATEFASQGRKWWQLTEDGSLPD